MRKLFFYFIAVIGCGIFLGILLTPLSPVQTPGPALPEESLSRPSAESANVPAEPAHPGKSLARADLRPLRNRPAETNGPHSPASDTSASATASFSATPVTLPNQAAIPITGIPAEADLWSLPAGLQPIATTNYSRAMQNLAAADSPFTRYLALGQAGKWSSVFGQTEEARRYASELLSLHEQFQSQPWRDGGAVHEGNLVLGRIALQEGRMDEAREYLLKAGSTTGSPVLGSFGPNMALARDLIQKGESQAVLDYFEQCRRFWSMGHEKLNTWAEDVKAGRVPNFGANLLY